MTSSSDRDDRDPVDRDLRADLRQAYEQGRRDARRARRRHPVAMTLTVVAAIIGVIVLVLAALNGSFGGAGSVVDRNLAIAAEEAQPLVRKATDQAGQAVRDTPSNDGTAPTDRPR